ncbi:hypothetical protein M0R04_13795 [Candidatus Dojkabacteria bacterium]|nr:hypothetical protein [Candidatus Dojkabacteria bacterium]
MNNFTTIVTGVPRSGTSMTMRILEMGGIPIIGNENMRLRAEAPRINKYGCYEHGSVEINKCKGDLMYYRGKAIKIWNAKLLKETPVGKYKVIIPMRDSKQVLYSQVSALHRDFSPHVDNHNAEALKRRIDVIKSRSDMELLTIPYNDFFEKTEEVCQLIGDFIGEGFDVKNAIKAVDKTLFKVRTRESINQLVATR